MLRRTLATVAAAGIAFVGLTPTASAQNAEDLIANVPCPFAEIALRSAFQINENTTRSDLAKQIRDAAKPVTGNDVGTYLLGAQYAGQIADKALECGIVKADPQLIPGSSIPGLENIPNIGDIQDILQGLSSTLQPR
ncbi:MAG TPA: hypothetical protein K8V93_07870 [Corynebacterium pollutisoli]|nr:hypothetical protein [Corynebacterium pollutisoli]